MFALTDLEFCTIGLCATIVLCTIGLGTLLSPIDPPGVLERSLRMSAPSSN